MKSLLRTAAAILATATLAFGSEGWMTDWEAAKAKSKEEKKPILICLTGSDWCGWCIKLEKEVFSKKEFQDFAKENLILMEADYPKKKEQPAELKKQNAALEKKYLKGGYPTVFLLDAEDVVAPLIGVGRTQRCDQHECDCHDQRQPSNCTVHHALSAPVPL